MMASGDRGRGPAKLLALFVLLAGIPLVALGWLGYRVLQQDRAIESQQRRARLEDAATLVTRELDRTLAAWEGLLPAAAGGQVIALPDDAVFLLIGADGVVQQQGKALPYYPRVADPPPTWSSLFAAAEADEFREGNLPAAIAAYRQLAASRDEPVRAEALMRLARCLRKQQMTDEALDAYATLSGLGASRVAGSPATLVARRERIALMTSLGRVDEAAAERVLLTTALAEARVRIDRTTYEYFRESSSLGAATPMPLAGAVEALWPEWMSQPSGRSATTSGADSFASVWRNTPQGTAVITAHLRSVAESIREPLQNLHIGAQLDDRAGHALWGAVAAEARVTKTARETGLPWVVHIAAADSPVDRRLADSRRNLFAAGFILMALVISAAGYFVFRAVTRELRVARLQSDFVAAVSHEFRTPLTAMCHLTEMLEAGDATPARLPDYYRALGRESRRLHAMVENLLDFGRMDPGRRTYDFEETDAIELVDHVAQEFADRSETAARRIEKSPSSAHATFVRADREALALAVRNLLDNAMKYSPDASPVRVAVARHNGRIAVSVADRGAGIGAQERREIFRKFTRGAASRALNVKGTGIGLTMADEIVKAHGGQLELESEPGRGSTFTIVLPAVGP